MVRKRTESILLNVDIDGIEVPACLRPPGDGRACYHVRWKLHGRWQGKSTGTTVLEEAKRIGRSIVRGEHVVRPIDQGRLSVERFIEIQREHYRNSEYPQKGERTFKKFLGAWNCFRDEFPNFKFVQEVSRDMAHRYIEKYRNSRRDRNFTYRTKSDDKVKAKTVDGHVRSLRAAWNRVRLGHAKAKAGLHESAMVTRNPWEEVSNEVPKGPRKEIVQFDLSRNELEVLLDGFREREIATLFLIVSFWANGRIEAMCNLSWPWIDDHGYIDIPDSIAKNATGKIVRIPLGLLSRLKAIEVQSSDFVFEGFAEELRNFHRRDPRKAHHADPVLDFTPDRMKHRMQAHIRKWVNGKGLAGHTHHSLRKTGMELSDVGELLQLESKSAQALRTTTGNKRQNYLMRRRAKRHYLLADALYRNFHNSLREFPALAERLMADPVDESPNSDLMDRIRELPPEQQAKLMQEMMAELFGTNRSAG